MPILSSQCRCLILALVFIATGVVQAKAPLKRTVVERVPQSITPKPKEWAMDDEPLAPPPPPRPGAAAGAPVPGAAQAGPLRPGSPVPGSVERETGVASLESVPVAPVHSHKVLPWFWLVVTGVMSLGALGMCGMLILRDETVESDGVPVVPDSLEVKA